MNKIDVSIIIPTKNAESDIEKCLNGIFQQKTGLKYEVVVIDSGSTDNTLQIVEKFPVQLIPINAEEFGHGKTRNLGASLAQGKYLVYLTQDACPADEGWLENLITNFTAERVAGVYSRWIPKEDCNPLELRRILELFGPFKEIRALTGINIDDYSKYIKRFIHFSNVSSAIARDIWQKIPFNDYAVFAEDQEWARRVLEAGYTIIYEPKSKVYHSHNDSLKTCFKRGFDGAGFLKQTKNLSMNPLYNFSVVLFLIMEDSAFIMRNRFGIVKKIRWIAYSVILNITRQVSVSLGACRNKL